MNAAPQAAIKALENALENIHEHLNAYQHEIDDIIKKMRQYEVEAKEIHRAIQVLKGVTPTAGFETNGSYARKTELFNPGGAIYPKNGSWWDKVVYILNEKQRFLHNREIAEYIVHKENRPDLEDVVASLSVHISRYKKEGRLEFYRVGSSNRNNFYGFRQWLNEDGTIKQGHEYNEKYVMDKVV